MTTAAAADDPPVTFPETPAPVPTPPPSASAHPAVVIKERNPLTNLAMSVIAPKHGWGIVHNMYRDRNGHFSTVKLVRQVAMRSLIGFGVVVGIGAFATGSLIALWFPATVLGLSALFRIPNIKRNLKESGQRISANMRRAFRGEEWDTEEMVKTPTVEAPDVDTAAGPAPVHPTAPGTPTAAGAPTQQQYVPTPMHATDRPYTLTDPWANFYLTKVNEIYAARDVGEIREIVDRVKHQPEGGGGDQARRLRQLLIGVEGATSVEGARMDIDRALAPLDRAAAANGQAIVRSALRPPKMKMGWGAPVPVEAAVPPHQLTEAEIRGANQGFYTGPDQGGIGNPNPGAPGGAGEVGGF